MKRIPVREVFFNTPDGSVNGQHVASAAFRRSPPEDVIALWAAVPYLEDLSQELVAALASAAAPREYAAGELIFDEGAPVAGLFMIEVGVVRITRFTKEGREHILHLLYRGDTFNDVAAMDGGPNPATSVAHVDSVVWHISRSELRRIADQHPELAWALVESIARLPDTCWDWSRICRCAMCAVAWQICC